MVSSRMLVRGPLVDSLMMSCKCTLAITFESTLVTGEWHVRVMCVYHMKIEVTQGHIIDVTYMEPRNA